MSKKVPLSTMDNFFLKTWKPELPSYKYTGLNLVAEIKSKNPKYVLDIGCGYNEFKGLIPNLIGIDIVNPKADLVCDLMDTPFHEESFDVAMALGSINFGDEQNVTDHLRVAAKYVKIGGYLIMRVNPGIPHEACPEIEIFPWSRENIVTIGESCGLELASRIMDDHKGRLSFWYIRKS